LFLSAMSGSVGVADGSGAGAGAAALSPTAFFFFFFFFRSLHSLRPSWKRGAVAVSFQKHRISLASLVRRGCAVAQSGGASEPPPGSRGSRRQAPAFRACA
jgi:hypothetical protein